MIFLTTLIAFLTLTLPVNARERFFQVQSIDTMKFSRDVAREKLKDLSYDQEIQTQVKNIANTGATHVAIATPYDEEFLPFLKRWVKAARDSELNVWFRGNFSGWEKWFDYPKISRDEHTAKTKEFILKNPDLFEDGDIFSSCPECENGGPGDPRMKGDAEGFKRFIIAEYQAAKDSFQSIGKQVSANYYSMNGDVARLIMDEETTKGLDGIVTIDHYVSTTEKLLQDIKDYAQRSGGKVVLGEFGAPIPDIHGKMSEDDQARWIDQAMIELVSLPDVAGVNYWTNRGSSTQLWTDNNEPLKAVEILAKYYDPINIVGSVKDEADKPLDGVEVKGEEKTTVSKNGRYALPVLAGEKVSFSKSGHEIVNVRVREEKSKDIEKDIVLKWSHPSLIYSLFIKIIRFIKILFK